MLKELGIVIGDDTKAGNIFESLFPDFMDFKYEKPSEYIKHFWDKYESQENRNSNSNGKMFEYILASLCIREESYHYTWVQKLPSFQMSFTTSCFTPKKEVQFVGV